MPETSLRKTMETYFFLRFPVWGEIYTVFDEESNFQVENSQFRQPGQNIHKHMISKHIIFDILVLKAPVVHTGTQQSKTTNKRIRLRSTIRNRSISLRFWTFLRFSRESQGQRRKN